MTDRSFFFGYFTIGRESFCVEGERADDCLHVSKLLSPIETVPLCVITGRDRNRSHELLAGGEGWPDGYRQKLIFEAVNCYRLWLVDH